MHQKLPSSRHCRRLRRLGATQRPLLARTAVGRRARLAHDTRPCGALALPDGATDPPDAPALHRQRPGRAGHPGVLEVRASRGSARAVAALGVPGRSPVPRPLASDCTPPGFQRAMSDSAAGCTRQSRSRPCGSRALRERRRRRSG
ncbi:MAG: hypothetical protein MZW92_57320 [Comamonadaceae bacterium]|nr:hypothetical protein [Comamonadaceae bacterium]